MLQKRVVFYFAFRKKKEGAPDGSRSGRKLNYLHTRGMVERFSALERGWRGLGLERKVMASPEGIKGE